MNYKIAIVGQKEVTAGFSILGFDEYRVENSSEASELLFELKKKNADENTQEKYAIIFVIEDFLKEIPLDDYKKLSSGALPAIIPLPSHTGSTGFGETKIRRIVEKAVGSDIFS